MTDRGLPSPPKKNKKKTQAEKDAQLAHRREKAIAELCQTETTYCNLLGLLIQYYVQPLSDYRLISEVEHNTLFPQLLIIRNLSEKFLADLTERRQNWDQDRTKLSDLFEEFTPFFKMYQGYVNGHEKAVQLMREMEDREKWLEYKRSVRKNCKGFDLSRYITNITHTPHLRNININTSMHRTRRPHYYKHTDTRIHTESEQKKKKNNNENNKKVNVNGDFSRIQIAHTRDTRSTYTLSVTYN